ncbi:MAG: hypothetical protein ABSD63_13075 [Candidatus Korobacteraceae bacterium]
MADLSPLNGPMPEGLHLVVLKSYLDGGGKDDSSQYAVMSLASISAIPDDWMPFDTEWRLVLQRYFGDRAAGYLHTTDALTGNSVYKGWGRTKVFDFLSQCSEIAVKHILKPRNRETGFPGKYGLYAFVITIVLADFVEHARSHPDAPQNANELSLRQALAKVLKWSERGANPRCDECHLFFDQGEEFYGHLVQLLQSKKAKKDADALNRITSRTEADMRRVAALQLADLIAWCHSHKLDENKPEWHKAILNSGIQVHWADKAAFASGMPDQQEIWKSWNLPRHKPTR